MESFLVHVCGGPFGIDPGSESIYKGPWTHMRSEGTYTLAIALNLAQHGHPVTIAMYGWGDQNKYPLPENVSLIKSFEGTYDYYIDHGEPWDAFEQRGKNVKASKYIFGYGGAPNHPKFFDDNWDPRWRVARPNLCFKDWYDKLPPNRGIYMPHPLSEKLYPPNVDSKYMVWGNRGSFCTADYSRASEQVLQLMERHSEYTYLVLLYSDIKGTHFDKKIPGASPDIISRFEKLPDVVLDEPYYGLDHDVLLGKLKKSKVLLSNGRPACNPLPIEQVCFGGITLAWEEGPFVTVAQKYGFFGAGIDELLDSRELYIKYQEEQADIAKDHVYENAYRIFMEELND